MKKILLTSLIVMGLSSANACSDLSNWTNKEGSVSIATVPSMSDGIVGTDSATRLEGLCSLEAKSAGDYVSTDLVGASTDTYIRFYVFYKNGIEGTAKVASLKAGSEELEGNIGPEGFSFGTSDVAALNQNKWNAIQVHVTPNKTEIWVNDFSTVAASAPSGLASAPNHFALGGISGDVTGSVFFDSVIVKSGEVINDQSVSLVENNQNAKVLIPGDANGDGKLSIFDLISVSNNGTKASEGFPDCNLDGKVSVFDVICITSSMKK